MTLKKIAQGHNYYREYMSEVKHTRPFTYKFKWLVNMVWNNLINKQRGI